MSITSFAFMAFLAIVLLVYYLVPGQLQWLVLLGASFVYYVNAGESSLIVWPILSATAVWFGVRALSRLDRKAARQQEAGKEVDPAVARRRRWILWAEVLLLLGILAVFKYTGLVLGAEHSLSLAVPTGLSFYTFILLGYFIDVYTGIAPAIGGWGQTLLVGMYFPLLTSGPIVTHREDKDPLFAAHPVSYENLTYGVQRILWGLFKELVISQRCATLAAAIFDNDTTYTGAYIWVGALAFTIELYTNFSGCMDIVLGVSECLGIPLPENFRTPFLSKSISEYWRRWHATLGIWMKDHVFYPLLRTQWFINQGKWLRARLGKKPGKNVNTYLAMLILWFTVGLWHGGDFKYVIGCGLLHWFYIVTGEVTLPFWKRVCGVLHIDMASKGMDVFRVVRTFVLVNIGNVFFNADSTGHALRMLAEGVTVWNPGVLVDGSLLSLGLAWDDYLVLAIAMVILIVVSAMQYRAELAGTADTSHIVRHRIAARPLPIRWVIWIVFFMMVLLWGQYGPDFSAAEFIYQGF